MSFSFRLSLLASLLASACVHQPIAQARLKPAPSVDESNTARLRQPNQIADAIVAAKTPGQEARDALCIAIGEVGASVGQGVPLQPDVAATLVHYHDVAHCEQALSASIERAARGGKWRATLTMVYPNTREWRRPDPVDGVNSTSWPYSEDHSALALPTFRDSAAPEIGSLVIADIQVTRTLLTLGRDQFNPANAGAATALRGYLPDGTALILANTEAEMAALEAGLARPGDEPTAARVLARSTADGSSIISPDYGVLIVRTDTHAAESPHAYDYEGAMQIELGEFEQSTGCGTAKAVVPSGTCAVLRDAH